jgi:hypothetical protein
MHNYCLLLLICFLLWLQSPPVTYVCTLLRQEMLSLGLCFSILTIPVQAFVIGTYTHNHTTYLVCSHGNQHICFNPTYCPWSNGWRSGASATLGTSSAAPRCLVLINQCQCSLMHVQPYISCGCGELAWERAYTSNNKYMCWEDSSWPCNDVGSYCPYWDLVSWATW